MNTKTELPNCTIEDTMQFSVIAKNCRTFPNGQESIVIEFDEAKIWPKDEKHVIKTFSDATLIDEISRRYDIDLIINKIK